MLISRWFLLEVLILVQCALCSDVHDDLSVNGKSSEQLLEIETYRYHHPPQLEIAEEATNRREKSIGINEQTFPTPPKSHSRVIRRKKIRKANTKSDLEIPVEVLFDSQSTTVRTSGKRVRPSETTSSPVERTTRVIVQRKRLQPSNTNKKIDIRETTVNNTSITKDKVSEAIQTSTENNNLTSSTAFPSRSRKSYFRERTEPPAPRVKILEEKNFVFSHSGNFHYSFVGGDGTRVSSEGSLKSYENEKTGESVSGNVFYTDKDGNDFNLSYTADENGYRPKGAHLPTPPPIPLAIARALQYIAEKNKTTTPGTDNDN